MKKKIIISIGILILAALAIFGANYLLSFHKVLFALENDTASITIYNSDDKEVGKLSSNSDISLQAGEYYIIPGGENIATDKIAFTVNKDDTNVIINPPYTKEYLESVLKGEKLAIEAAITTKYPSLISEYTIKHGTLYERGDWFGGLLAPKVSDIRDERDAYRIVLHKKDTSWEVIRRPEYTLSSSRYKEVPITILRAVNAIVE